MAAPRLDENDLLRHTNVRQIVHGDEAVWINSISAADGGRDAVVALSIDNLTLVGRASHIIDRLRAAVVMIEVALDRPEQWQDLQPMVVDGKRRVGARPHPFSDRPRSRDTMIDG